MNLVPSRRLAESGELLAVAQGLDDVKAADALLAVEIGERARDAQDTMIAARRQHHRIRGLMQDAQARLVRRRYLIEKRAVGLPIGGKIGKAELRETLTLALACLGDTGRDFGAAFGRDRPCQIGGAHRAKFDLNVEPVE